MTGARLGAFLLLVQAALVITLYAPTLRFWFLSDAWALMDQARGSVWHALTTTVAYHYIPVASVLNVAMFRLLKLNATGYQAVAIALHLAVGWRVYRLGVELFRDVPAAVVASLLFLGSAAFYEVTFWPVVGTGYVLAAVFYLQGVDALVRMIDADRVSLAGYRLALWFLLATFTYPGMVTLAPLAVLVLPVARFRGLGARLRRPWRSPAEWLWLARALLPTIAAVALTVIVRGHFASALSQSTFVRVDWVRAYWFLRGLLTVGALRGSPEIADTTLTLGGRLTISTGLPAVVWGCVAVGALLVLRAFVQSSRLAPPLLSSWLFLQILTTAFAILVSSRHVYLASVPAVLLIARALACLGRRVARPIRARIARGCVSLGVLALGGLLLSWGARRDLNVATVVWGEASNVGRETVEAIRSEIWSRQGKVSVILVNMPSGVLRGGIHAPIFTNRTPEMARVVFGESTASVDVRHVRDQVPNVDRWSPEVTGSELRDLASKSQTIVFVYEPESRSLRRLSLGEVSTANSSWGSGARSSDLRGRIRGH